MESAKTSLTNAIDRDTWLFRLGPGLILSVSLLLASPRSLHGIPGMSDDIGAEAKAIVLLAIGLSSSLAFGLISSPAARLLERTRLAWWAMCLPKRFQRFMQQQIRRLRHQGPAPSTPALPVFPSAEGVAWTLYGNELLPYSLQAVSLKTGDERLGDAPEFALRMCRKVAQLAGPKSELPILKVLHLAMQCRDCRMGGPSCRPYDGIASDLIRAWVGTRVGREVSAAAWDAAWNLRTWGDAYRPLSFALPASLLIAGIPTAVRLVHSMRTSAAVHVLILAGATALLAVAALFVAYTCQLLVYRYWVGWQNELCRIFDVAFADPVEQSDPGGTPSRRQST